MIFRIKSIGTLPQKVPGVYRNGVCPEAVYNTLLLYMALPQWASAVIEYIS